MKITSELKDSVLTVVPDSRIDSATSEELMTFLEENFNEDIQSLILDFTDVDFISSKGIRVLVTVYKNLGTRSMEIINANTMVKEVLRLSGLIKLFIKDEK